MKILEYPVRRRTPFWILFLVGVVFCTSQALADIIKVRDLNFGNLIILNNEEPRSFTLTATEETIPSEYIFLMDAYPDDQNKPTAAKFKIDALPEHSQISVRADDIRLEAQLSDNYFIVKDIVISTAQTDSAGDVEFYLGGTLETSGNGMVYAEDIYSGFMPLTVSY